MQLSLENMLPQQPPMRLIDSILEVNEKFAKSRVKITENNLFYDSEICGIYAWVGIEFMAQTVAAFASFQSNQPKPQIGFLISVRKFSSNKPYFALGDNLTVIADKEYLEENVGVFACRIMLDDQVIASAKLNAFQPSENQVQIYLARS